MKSLTHSDLDVLLGAKGTKPWCSADAGVDVAKFMDLFINANFQPELALFAFLQRDQNWIELLRALQTLDTGGAAAAAASSAGAAQRNVGGGVGRPDMELALERFLALDVLSRGIMRDLGADRPQSRYKRLRGLKADRTRGPSLWDKAASRPIHSRESDPLPRKRSTPEKAFHSRESLGVKALE
jgi:hypothetical protein